MRCLLAVLLAPALFAQGIITTVAGSNWLFPGDNRPALNAPLGVISEVATGPDGSLYIADPDNVMIFRVGKDGILHVFAGTGGIGFSGDNGPATQATFNRPTGVTVDSAGNVYIADADNSRIRKVDTKGIISTYAGTGEYDSFGENIPATLAKFRSPYMVSADPSGNLYVADTGSSTVRRIDAASGLITTLAGTGSDGYSGDNAKANTAALALPYGIFADAKGQVWIADTGNHRIRRVGTDGIIRTIVGNGQNYPLQDGVKADQGAISAPVGVTVDSAGVIYFADADDLRIHKVGLDGILTTLAGTSGRGYSGDGGPASKAQFGEPISVALDASGNLYISDDRDRRVRIVTPDQNIQTFAGNGGFKYGGDGGKATGGLLNKPSVVVFDSNGNTYISDTQNHRVRKIDRNGNISTIAGDGIPRYAGDGGPATQASFNEPYGLAIDPAGLLYIADEVNGRIRKIDSNGIITTVAGGGDIEGDNIQATQASLADPTYITFDSAGNLYISEANGFVVDRVTRDGTLKIFAGNRGSENKGDGGLATSASINYPGDIAFDSKGNAYIGEPIAGVVRKITPDGKISTYAGVPFGPCCFSGDGGLATKAVLDADGLTFDRQDNLYISGRDRVRRVTPEGIISLYAGGTNYSGVLGDGGSSLSAYLNRPLSVRADAAGNIYIADTDDDRIRQVLNVQPPFTVSPSLLQFTAKSGGASTVAQTLSVSSSVTNLIYHVSADSDSAGWIRFDSMDGLAPGTIQVSIDPANLPPGNYEGRVSVTAPDALPPLIIVNVKATIAAADAPTLLAEPNNLSFDFVQGLPGSSQQLILRNNGSGTIPVNITATSTVPGWLSVSPTSASLTAAAPQTVLVSAKPGSLPPGTYQGLISIASTDGALHFFVTVTMTVHSTSQVITINQTGFGFSAAEGSQNTQSDGVYVTNPGLGTLNFTVATKVLSGGANWLSASPPSAAAGPAGGSGAQITVTVNPANLTAGIYYGQITLTSQGASNSPVVIPVVFNIVRSTVPTLPDVRPTGLIFVGQQGTQVAAQQFTITNIGGTPNSFRSTSTGSGVPVFFTAQPAEGALPPGQPAPVSVQANLTGLSPGVRRGNISLTFDDGSTRAVQVLLVIPDFSGASQPAISKAREAGTCTPTNLNLVFTALGQGYQTPVSFPTPVEVKVVDNCGVFLDSGFVSASFSNGDAPLPLSPIGGGRWSATWRPGTSPTNVEVAVTAESSDHTLKGSVKATGTTTPNPFVPVLQPGSVVSAAGPAARAVVAPGELITIYGLNLNSSSQTGTIPLQTFLNGTVAVLGGSSMPLLYVGANQVNAQVPYDLPVNTNQQLFIQNGNALTIPIAVPIAPAHPAIFTPDSSGIGQGDIFDVNNQLVDASHPAKVGDTVVIYCSGLGAVDHPVIAGTAAPSDVLARTSSPVQVSIGGQDATVSFAGLTPAFAGLYQLNVVVPTGVTPGGAVPVTITTSGQLSPTVTMAIR